MLHVAAVAGVLLLGYLQLVLSITGRLATWWRGG